MVSHQKSRDSYYDSNGYSVFNALAIYLGCICYYSLLNVNSILIKEQIVVKLTHCITRRCMCCYYDPNMEAAAATGRIRRRHASFALPPDSRAVSTIELPKNRTRQTSLSVEDHYRRQSVSTSIARKQYQNNINCIAQEAAMYDDSGDEDSNYETASMKSCSSTVAPDVRSHMCNNNKVHRHSVFRDRRLFPERMRSVSETVTERQKTAHSMEVETMARDYAPAASRRSIFVENDLMLGGRPMRASAGVKLKPRMRHQGEVGAMNILSTALHKGAAADDSLSSIDSYDENT